MARRNEGGAGDKVPSWLLWLGRCGHAALCKSIKHRPDADPFPRVEPSERGQSRAEGSGTRPARSTMQSARCAKWALRGATRDACGGNVERDERRVVDNWQHRIGGDLDVRMAVSGRRG